MINVKESIKAQKIFCETNKKPNFVGNGACFSCHRQIFEKITLEKAQTDLITGCPYCRVSFCE